LGLMLIAITNPHYINSVTDLFGLCYRTDSLSIATLLTSMDGGNADTTVGSSLARHPWQSQDFQSC